MRPTAAIATHWRSIEQEAYSQSEPLGRDPAGGARLPGGRNRAQRSARKPALFASQVAAPRPASRSLYFWIFWFGV